MTTKNSQPDPALRLRDDTARTGWQMRSLVTQDGALLLSLERVPTPEPAPDEVVIRIEASPINPSDIGLLFGAADMAALTTSGNGSESVVRGRVPAAAMPSMAGRAGQSLPVGNEGAGTVVHAGDDAAAQALLGRQVAVLAGGMYAQYRTVKAADCLPLPPGLAAADGASALVNPMTALAMVGTMRLEGHSALVHTAAASNLGQMLNRLCRRDGIGLVNIVRRPEQEALLRALGAEHVVNTAMPGFEDDLARCIEATGATLAFDATGGGRLAGQILAAMERTLSRSAAVYSRYGSTTHKQVYIYGGLDTAPTEFERSFGMHWGIGGWLLHGFLRRVGAQQEQALRKRVADELKTTFASRYTRVVSLAGALAPDAIAEYGRRATASKLLIDPSR